MIIRQYFVACDTCGETLRALGGFRPLASTNVVAARLKAKQRGWTRVPRRTGAEGGSRGADYCPDCAASASGGAVA